MCSSDLATILQVHHIIFGSTVHPPYYRFIILFFVPQFTYKYNSTDQNIIFCPTVHSRCYRFKILGISAHSEIPFYLWREGCGKNCFSTAHSISSIGPVFSSNEIVHFVQKRYSFLWIIFLKVFLFSQRCY